MRGKEADMREWQSKEGVTDTEGEGQIWECENENDKMSGRGSDMKE